MPGLQQREPIEVWLTVNGGGVAVRVYAQGGRLADAYHSDAASIQEAQAEVTARYTGRGYTTDGGWRPQRWTTGRTGYGVITHESSCTFR